MNVVAPRKSWLRRCITRLRHACRRTLDNPAWRLTESLAFTFLCQWESGRDFPTDREWGRVVRSFTTCCERLEGLASSDQMVEVVKYWVTFYVWKVSQSVDLPPVCPDFVRHGLFSGYLRKYVGIALARGKRSFFLSLQKGKTYWPQLSDEKEQKALDDHKAFLGDPSIKVVSDDILKEIYRSTKLQTSQKFCPTQSACLQASRADGGSLSLFPRFKPEKSSKVSKIIGVPRATFLDFEEFRERVLWESMPAGRAGTVNPTMEVVALAEPGKFRVITKMDGMTAGCLQPLQGSLINWWKRQHENTMNHDVEEMVVEIAREMADLPLWNSGDYKNATDTLVGMASYAGLDSLLTSVSFDERYFSRGELYSSFLFNELFYPDGTRIRQFCGQPMGHPLSFPVLCLLNRAAFRASVRRYIREVRMGDQLGFTEILLSAETPVVGPALPRGAQFVLKMVRRMYRRLKYRMLYNVIINGDDILFKTTQRHYEIWRETVAEIGLKLSPGKSYLSPDFAQLNSRSFTVKGKKVTEHGYLNLKLMTGFCLKTGDSASEPEQIGKDLGKMVLLEPWTSAGVAFAFERWSSRWMGPFRPNWYLPQHLGGYGVTPKIANDIVITPWQRKVAAMFVADPKLALTKEKGGGIPLSPELRTLLPPMDLVPFDEEVSEDQNLIARFALISQWTSPASSRVSDGRFYFSLRKKWKSAAPMSDRGILKYWEPRFRYPAWLDIPETPLLYTFVDKDRPIEGEQNSFADAPEGTTSAMVAAARAAGDLPAYFQSTEVEPGSPEIGEVPSLEETSSEESDDPDCGCTCHPSWKRHARGRHRKMCPGCACHDFCWCDDDESLCGSPSCSALARN